MKKKYKFERFNQTSVAILFSSTRKAVKMDMFKNWNGNGVYRNHDAYIGLRYNRCCN